ncbi:MAG: Flp pilus assembly complex ATPase component TadA [Candidatus Omnitrophica bacterium]|nr:Flp pilus assembly complex ATPase component TadA [Candidatus Omnitrophota bacterium]
MASFRQRIASLLVEQGIAPKEQMDKLLAESSKNGQGFGQLLIERSIISETKLTELLSKELGLPLISLVKYRIDSNSAQLIPERMARQYQLIALHKRGDQLLVAMADPLNIFAIDDLKAITQGTVAPVICSETEIRRAIEQIYASQAQAVAARAAEGIEGPDGDIGTLDTAIALLLNEGGEEEGPVVRVINLMVIEAIRRHASDIHLEPMATCLKVRLRIDGHLVDSHKLPKAVQNPVLTRLKIMSGMDITEWRQPQDGRFKVRLDEKEIDFRVSVLPITHGGKVVMRLLDQANLSVGLDHLGFLPQSIERFKEVVKRPYGMILVTGPTGSGKSTTLYSILNELNKPTRNIITVEDPVEYQVEGIIQMQVNPDIGLTFASGLRSLLRQSPDVVMIGEIRDFETADIAMKASLTGQLVLSTLHTNDAASAVTRLVDMGVEPFLVASSVCLIEAQRLVRKLCSKCRQPYQPEPEVLERIGLTAADGGTFYRPGGCRMCNQTGFRGRMGIIEVIPIDEKIRELIVSRAQSWEIKTHAVTNLGALTMRQDGLKKAQLGVTTFEEVIAVTTEE